MNPSSLKIEKTDTGVQFAVKAVPGSSRTSIAGTLGGALKVKIAAPPEDGKANRMLLEFLSGVLGIRKNQITIAAGAASPVKILRIDRITPEQILRTLKEDNQTYE
ncbi:MAG: DUF167 domain-containing protein [Anaerohalosphaeraceae bacterium]